jgi:hypothetical protein
VEEVKQEERLVFEGERCRSSLLNNAIARRRVLDVTGRVAIELKE